MAKVTKQENGKKTAKPKQAITKETVFVKEEATIAVHVSASVASLVSDYAEKCSISKREAADKLVRTAVSRLAALAKYAIGKSAEA